MSSRRRTRPSAINTSLQASRASQHTRQHFHSLREASSTKAARSSVVKGGLFSPSFTVGNFDVRNGFRMVSSTQVNARSRHDPKAFISVSQHSRERPEHSPRARSARVLEDTIHGFASVDTQRTWSSSTRSRDSKRANGYAGGGSSRKASVAAAAGTGEGDDDAHARSTSCTSQGSNVSSSSNSNSDNNRQTQRRTGSSHARNTSRAEALANYTAHGQEDDEQGEVLHASQSGTSQGTGHTISNSSSSSSSSRGSGTGVDEREEKRRGSSSSRMPKLGPRLMLHAVDENELVAGQQYVLQQNDYDVLAAHDGTHTAHTLEPQGRSKRSGSVSSEASDMSTLSQMSSMGFDGFLFGRERLKRAAENIMAEQGRRRSSGVTDGLDEGEDDEEGGEYDRHGGGGGGGRASRGVHFVDVPSVDDGIMAGQLHRAESLSDDHDGMTASAEVKGKKQREQFFHTEQVEGVDFLARNLRIVQGDTGAAMSSLVRKMQLAKRLAAKKQRQRTGAAGAEAGQEDEERSRDGAGGWEHDRSYHDEDGLHETGSSGSSSSSSSNPEFEHIKRSGVGAAIIDTALQTTEADALTAMLRSSKDKEKGMGGKRLGRNSSRHSTSSNNSGGKQHQQEQHATQKRPTTSSSSSSSSSSVSFDLQALDSEIDSSQMTNEHADIPGVGQSSLHWGMHASSSSSGKGRHGLGEHDENGEDGDGTDEEEEEEDESTLGSPRVVKFRETKHFTRTQYLQQQQLRLQSTANAVKVEGVQGMAAIDRLPSTERDDLYDETMGMLMELMQEVESTERVRLECAKRLWKQHVANSAILRARQSQQELEEGLRGGSGGRWRYGGKETAMYMYTVDVEAVVDTFVHLLETGTEVTRVHAAAFLKRNPLQHDRVVEQLMECLTDASARVVVEAEKALGGLNVHDAKLVSSLLLRLNTAGWRQRLSAIVLLRRCSDDPRVSKALHRVAKEDWNFKVRLEACNSLIELGERDMVVDALTVSANDKDDSARKQVMMILRACTQLLTEDIGFLLIRGAADLCTPVRLEAFKALTARGIRSASCEDALFATLDTDNWQLKVEAIKSLGKLYTSESPEERLRISNRLASQLSETHSAVLSETARVLTDLGMAHKLRLHESQKLEVVKQSAQVFLGRSGSRASVRSQGSAGGGAVEGVGAGAGAGGGESGTRSGRTTPRGGGTAGQGSRGANVQQQQVQELVDVLQHSFSWCERAEAAADLGVYGEDEEMVVNALLRASKDAHNYVRAQATRSLGMVGSLQTRILDCMHSQLEDEDWSVRAEAVHALGRLRPPGEGSIKAVLPLVGDSDNMVRFQAAKTLMYLGHQSESFEERKTIVETLLDSMEDRYQSVRHQIVKTVGALVQDTAMMDDELYLEIMLECLHDQYVKVRLAALRNLGCLPTVTRDTAAAVVACLAHKNEELRVHAAAVLGAYPNAASESLVVDALTRMLEDANPNARFAAAKALVRLGLKDLRLVAPLVTKLGDKLWRERVEACQTLGALAIVDDKLLAMLSERVADSNQMVQVAASQALLAMNQSELVVSNLIEQLGDRVDAIKVRAARVLAQLQVQDSRVVSALLVCLLDPNDTLQRQAASTLESIGAAKKAITVLVRRLESDASGSKTQTTTALGKLCAYLRVTDERVLSILVGRLADDDWRTSVKAAASLAATGVAAPFVRTGLLSLLYSPKRKVHSSRRADDLMYGSEQAEALKALSALQFDDDQVIGAYLEHLEAEDTFVRVAAVAGLGACPSTRSETVLQHALVSKLNDKNLYVRAEVLSALVNLGMDGELVVAALIVGMQDVDELVRAQAVKACGALAMRDADLVYMLLDLLNDDYHQVRRMSAQTLGELGVRNDFIVNSLIVRLEDESFYVRAEVAKSLRLLSVRSKKVVRSLVSRLRDWNDMVFYESAKALAALNVRETQVIKPLLLHLQDGDAVTRQRAITSLSEMRVRTKEVVEAVLSGLNDTDAGVRLQSVIGLGLLRVRSDRVLGALMDKLDDEDPRVRVETTRSLQMIGFQDDAVLEELRKHARDDENDEVRELCLQQLRAHPQPVFDVLSTRSSSEN